MTASLRPIIAEILIHTAPAGDRDPGAWLGQLFGAETLYWCDEHELKGLPQRAEMADELDELRYIADEHEGCSDHDTVREMREMRAVVSDVRAELAHGFDEATFQRIREILAT